MREIACGSMIEWVGVRRVGEGGMTRALIISGFYSDIWKGKLPLIVTIAKQPR